jgi:hypothetical protein
MGHVRIHNEPASPLQIDRTDDATASGIEFQQILGDAEA